MRKMLPRRCAAGIARGSCLLAAVLGGAAAGSSGCAVGPLRQAQVGALAKYGSARSIRVAVTGTAPEEVRQALADTTQRALSARTGLVASTPGDSVETDTFRLEVHVETSVAAPPQVEGSGRALSQARSVLGLATAAGGKLALEARLFPPGAGRSVGLARWESEGDPSALAAGAGETLGDTLGGLIDERRRDFVERRAADERLLLTPTPLTMAPGEIAISDDEVLLGRLAVGVSKHLQLDVIAGGLPIPAAGGGAFAERAIFAGGGAGVAVIGFFDLGIKASLLHETERLPGFAASCDMLDLFGLGAGGAGIVVAGDGVGGGGYGVVGGANAQFNLFTLTAGKHFGDAQVTAGLWVLDNHHFLPQSAGFQSGCVAAASDGSGGVVAGGIDCGSGSATIPRLPTQVRSFFGAEYVFGPHVSVMAELLPTSHLSTSFVTTGLRVLLGFDRPRGIVALDRIKLRFDLGAIWTYIPAEPATNHGGAHDATVGYVPWAGLGVYLL
jgi:hypothetical protein